MRKSLTFDKTNLEIIDQPIIEINAINFEDIYMIITGIIMLFFIIIIN